MNKKYVAYFIISILLNSSLQLNSVAAFFHKRDKSLEEFVLDLSKTSTQEILNLANETKIIATKKGEVEFKEKNSAAYKFLILVINKEKIAITVEANGVSSFIGFTSSMDNVKLKKSDSNKAVFEIESLDTPAQRTLISVLFSSNSVPELSVKSNKGKVIFIESAKEFEDFITTLHSMESLIFVQQAYKDLFGKNPFLQIKIENVKTRTKDPAVNTIVNYLNSPRGTGDLYHILSGNPLKIDKIPNLKGEYVVAMNITGSKIGIWKNSVLVAVADIKTSVQARADSASSPQKPIRSQGSQQARSCENLGLKTCPNKAGCFLNDITECLGEEPITKQKVKELQEEYEKQKARRTGAYGVSGTVETLKAAFPGATILKELGDTCPKEATFCVATQCVGTVPSGYTLCKRAGKSYCEGHSGVVLENCFECSPSSPMGEACIKAKEKKLESLRQKKPQEQKPSTQPATPTTTGQEEKKEEVATSSIDPKIVIASGALISAGLLGTGYGPEIKDAFVSLYKDHIKTLAESPINGETLKNSIRPVVFSIFDENSKKFHLSINIPNDAVKNMELGVFDKEITPGIRLNINKKSANDATITIFTEKEGQVYKAAFNPQKNSKPIAQIISQNEKGVISYEDPRILKVDEKRVEVQKKIEEGIKAGESGDLVKAGEIEKELEKIARDIELGEIKKSRGIFDWIRDIVSGKKEQLVDANERQIIIPEGTETGPPEYKILQEGDRSKVTGCATCLTPDEEKRLKDSLSKSVDSDGIKTKSLDLNIRQSAERNIINLNRVESPQVKYGDFESWNKKLHIESNGRKIDLTEIFDNAGKRSKVAIGIRGSSYYLADESGKIPMDSIFDIDVSVHSKTLKINSDNLVKNLIDEFKKKDVIVQSVAHGPTPYTQRTIVRFTLEFPDGTSKPIFISSTYYQNKLYIDRNSIRQSVVGDLEAREDLKIKIFENRHRLDLDIGKAFGRDKFDTMHRSTRNYLEVLEEYGRYSKNPSLLDELNEAKRAFAAATASQDWKDLSKVNRKLAELFDQNEAGIKSFRYSDKVVSELISFPEIKLDDSLVSALFGKGESIKIGRLEISPSYQKGVYLVEDADARKVIGSFKPPEIPLDDRTTVSIMKGSGESMQGYFSTSDGQKINFICWCSRTQVLDDGATNALIKRQTFVSGQGKPTSLDISVPEIETRPPPSLGDAIFVYDAEKNTYIFGKGAEYVDLSDGEKWISLEDGSLIKVNKDAEVINLDEFRASGELLDTSNPKVVSIVGHPKIKEVSGGRKIIEFKPIGGGAEVETIVRYISELNPLEIKAASQAVENLREGEKATFVLNDVVTDFTKTADGIQITSSVGEDVRKVVSLEEGSTLAADLAKSGAKIAEGMPLGTLSKIAKTFGPLDVVAVAAVPLTGVAAGNFDDYLARQTVYNTVENLGIEPSALVTAGRVGLAGARTAIATSGVLAGVVAAELVAEAAIEDLLYRNSLSKMGLANPSKNTPEKIWEDFQDFVDFSAAKSAIQSSKQYENFVKNRKSEYISQAEENAINSGLREEFDNNLNGKLDGRKADIDSLVQDFWSSNQNAAKIGGTTLVRDGDTVLVKTENSEGILDIRYENIGGEIKPISYGQTLDLSKVKPDPATEFDVSNLGVGYAVGESESVIDIGAIEKKAREDAREKLIQSIKPDLEVLLNADSVQEAVDSARKIAAKLNQDGEVINAANVGKRFDAEDVIDIAIEGKKKNIKYYEDVANIGSAEDRLASEFLAEVENKQKEILEDAKGVLPRLPEESEITPTSEGTITPAFTTTPPSQTVSGEGSDFCKIFGFWPGCQVPSVEASTETAQEPRSAGEEPDFSPETEQGEQLTREEFCQRFPYAPSCKTSEIQGQCTEFTPEFCEGGEIPSGELPPEEVISEGGTTPTPDLTYDSDGDGLEDSTDPCKDDYFNECVNQPIPEEFNYDDDGDGIPDTEDSCPNDYFNQCIGGSQPFIPQPYIPSTEETMPTTYDYCQDFPELPECGGTYEGGYSEGGYSEGGYAGGGTTYDYCQDFPELPECGGGYYARIGQNFVNWLRSVFIPS